jgi:hypothetical protein
VTVTALTKKPKLFSVAIFCFAGLGIGGLIRDTNPIVAAPVLAPAVSSSDSDAWLTHLNIVAAKPYVENEPMLTSNMRSQIGAASSLDKPSRGPQTQGTLPKAGKPVPDMHSHNLAHSKTRLQPRTSLVRANLAVAAIPVSVAKEATQEVSNFVERPSRAETIVVTASKQVRASTVSELESGSRGNRVTISLPSSKS